MFVYGTQYYRPPTPPLQDWRTDLARIRDAGMNAIKIWALWAWVEPAPGDYRFEELDELFDIARGLDLRVVPLTTGAEMAPFWLERLIPDAHYVGGDGRRILCQPAPHCTVAMTPGYCTDNPAVRERMAAYLERVGAHFAGRSNLIVWDSWNEIMGIAACYCDHTIGRFRDWLAGRYGDLDGLGDAWGRRYDAWEDVRPPHKPGGTYPDMVDWLTFCTEKTADQARFREACIRRGDPNHEVMCHTGGSCLHWPEKITEVGCDDWLMAASSPRYGTSFFPGWYDLTPDLYAMLLDAIRSSCSGRPFWVAELQGGPSNVGLDLMRPITPEEQRKWVWGAIARGAKAVLYWQWRPEMAGLESPGYGLTHPDGSPSPRSEVAGQTGGLLRENGDLLEKLDVPRAEVAVLLDPQNMMMAYAAGEAAVYADSLRGYHKALWDAGICCDFLHVRDLVAIGRYRLVIVPFPMLVSRATADALGNYVRDGGFLMSEAYCGRFRDGCMGSPTVPGSGLDRVFGAREVELIAHPSPEVMITSAGRILPERLVGQTLRGARFQEEFESYDSAVVIGRFGEAPGLILGGIGGGRTLLAGTLLGVGYLETGGPLAELLGGVASSLGCDAPSAEMPGDRGTVETRLMQGDGVIAAFCINHGGQSQTVRVPLRAPSPECTPREITKSAALRFDRDGERVVCELEVPAQDVRVIVLQLAGPQV